LYEFNIIAKMTNVYMYISSTFALKTVFNFRNMYVVKRVHHQRFKRLTIWYIDTCNTTFRIHFYMQHPWIWFLTRNYNILYICISI